MKLDQIRTRYFWTIALAASALFAASTATAHTNDAIDPAYLLDSEFLVEHGIDPERNSPESFPLKRNSQGHWSIDTESLYIRDKLPETGILKHHSDSDAQFNVIQRRMGYFYDRHEYQQGFDEAVHFLRAMHAQGIGLELSFYKEYQNPQADIVMETYKLRLVHATNGHGRRVQGTLVPWRVPKVQHINPRSALSISQVSNAPAQDSR